MDGDNLFIALASVAIAVLSLMLNYLTVRRQVTLQREELRQSADANKLAWFEKCMTVLSTLKALARGRGAVFGATEFERQRIELSEKISALADQGRLYFPNIPAEKGQTKEGAYRGQRPAALASLLVAFDVAANLHNFPEDKGDHIAGLLFESRRIFVSEVQRSIDPRRRAVMLGQDREMDLEEDRRCYQSVLGIVQRLHANFVVKRSAFHE